MQKLCNLRYDSYSTGRYGSKLSEGINLQFLDIDTGAVYYVIFNVCLKRKRSSKKHAKDSFLPAKRFSVTKRRKFFRFWHYTCRLPIPSRGLTSFHDCMGKLKDIRFEAEVLEGDKLDKDTLRPSLTHIYPITSRQRPDKTPTIFPDKHILETKQKTDFEEIFTTCKSNHVISKQGKTDTRVSISYPRPKDVTDADADADARWLLQCEDYF